MSKQKLYELLNSGDITSNDLIDVYNETKANTVIYDAPERKTPSVAVSENKDFGTKAIAALFYIASILVVAAILVFINTAFGTFDDYSSSIFYEDSTSFYKGLTTALIAVAFWGVTYLLRHKSSSIIHEIKGSTIVAGILLFVSAAFYFSAAIANNNTFDMFYWDTTNVDFSPFYLFAGLLIVIALLSIGLDFFVKHNVALYNGIFLAGVSVWTAITTVLTQADIQDVDLYMVALIVSGVLVAMLTRLIPESRVSSVKENKNKLDYIVLLFSLLAMFIAQFGEYELLWLTGIILTTLGLFVLSIANRGKGYLGTASFFLAVAVNIIAFRFFGGYSIGFALLIGAVGVLGAAFFFVYLNKNLDKINKRMFKKNNQVEKV